MMTKKALVRLLIELPDEVLALLYSAWSEESYAAGWMMDGEPAFVRDVLEGRALDDYVYASLSKIREELRRAL